MDTKKELPVTCGVLITDGTQFLICHPTNGQWWDLPKGKQDPDESFAETAVRELREETGIRITEGQLRYIGQFKYKHDKDLALFEHRVETMPDPKALVCVSKFKAGMRWMPEMDAFRLVDRGTCLRLVNPSMNKVLSEVI